MNTSEVTQTDLRAWQGKTPDSGLLLAIELVAVFTLGLTVMTFLYAGPPGLPASEHGLPGYDDYYHVKMSLLLPRIGLIDQFPWLTTTIFADRFVNHHWGFQALMAPFVYAGKWLRGDELAGARWAITFFFAVAMVLFQLLLITERTPFRWLWLGLFLVMPAQFFGRHVFIRAIAPSLACMLAVMLLMFRRRYVWCALVIAFYVHVYLGALCYVPILVGAYFVMGLTGTTDDDGVSWKLPLWAALGLAAGWLTHPYRDGVFEFLQVQVFGSGLTPDIPVGREWKPYEGKLWELLFEYFGSTLSLLVVALVARLRMGERLNVREATVLVINFAFLVLAMRQRRFIEYWPPFGVLSSALLVGPLLARMASGAESSWQSRGGQWLSALGVAVAVAAWGVAAYLLYRRGPELGIDPFVAEWRSWAYLVGLAALAPFSWIWAASNRTEDRVRWWSGGANLLCGAWLIGAVFLPVWWVFPEAKLAKPRVGLLWMAWIGLGVAFLAVPYIIRSRPRAYSSRTAVMGVFGSAALVLLLVMGAGTQLTDLQRSSRGGFNLPAVREAMDYLRSVSAKDAIVFTDDWDIFPIYFYHNDHNRYIVGLDPKFSHVRDPALYMRYVKITQSKRFPVTAEVEVKDPQGRTTKESITVRLEDIRDRFHAEYVIVDPDHKILAQSLESAPEFAERVFPAAPRKGKNWPPYTIYRILTAKE